MTGAETSSGRTAFCCTSERSSADESCLCAPILPRKHSQSNCTLRPRATELRGPIEGDTSVQRIEKETEWIVITNQFQRLIEDAKRRSCLCEIVRHRECQKCVTEGHAGPMTIDMHLGLCQVVRNFVFLHFFESDCLVELAA